MHEIEYIILMFSAAFLSNIAGRFFTRLSVPVIQIIFGALIAMLPMGFHLELDPEAFLLLFIAPIVFHNSIHVDKASLWEMKWLILSFAFGLVIAGVFAGGFLTSRLIPSIPFAAACAMIAALGPTDVVAVASFSKSAGIPKGVMHLLDGEALFNDAAGIVSFQFAVAAMVTGAFSPVAALGQLLLKSVGGAAVGVALTAAKYGVSRWMRSHGIENVTLHILFELLTPFIVYLAAEKLGFSGVFSAVVSGLLHSIRKKQLTPGYVSFNIAADSIWHMLSFLLDGLIFIILGTRLPEILGTLVEGGFSIGLGEIVVCSLAIYFFFAALRFLWSFAFAGRLAAGAGLAERLKSSLMLSLSGTRGAITLAIALSLPNALADGSPFPERTLLILIATIAILCSLLLANYGLPLFGGKKRAGAADGEAAARIEILQGAVRALGAHLTADNEGAARRVSYGYLRRISELKRVNPNPGERQGAEQRLNGLTLGWKHEYINQLVERGELSPKLAERYKSLEKRIEGPHLHPRGLSHWLAFLKIDARNFAQSILYPDWILAQGAQFLALKRAVDMHVLENLRDMESRALAAAESGRCADGPGQGGKLSEAAALALSWRISEYEIHIALYAEKGGGPGATDWAGHKNALEEATAIGFQAERDGIQGMLEEGRLSRKTAKQMRDDVALAEIHLLES